MPVNRSPQDSGYSRAVGFLLVFNLIVGTGALALPKAFQTAGYGLSIALTIVSCFVSYVCATFVIESMAVANAAHVRMLRRKGVRVEDDSEQPFAINHRIEVSEMARLFLGRTGLLASYLALTVYLFGDLTIYSATVPKSIMNIICSSVNASTARGEYGCRSGWPLFFSRDVIYRFTVVAFTVFVTPMVLAGISRTKYLQMSTTFCRWSAFTLMIVLALVSLISDGPEASPPFANVRGFGPLFGTTVYAFMCHHSLPGLITPMRQKKKICVGLSLVYILVLTFYLALAVTGSFAFEHLFDVYSLNFLHDDTQSSFLIGVMNLFLALFPVFTLTTNYPIVASTLGCNLNVLVEVINETFTSLARVSSEEGRLLDADSDSDEQTRDVEPRTPRRRHLWRRWAIVSTVILLPMTIALATDNVLLLAALTGSYPGVGVQFVIPSLLVVYARRYSRREFGMPLPSYAASPFRSYFWPCAMFFWSAFTILMVTLNLYHF